MIRKLGLISQPQKQTITIYILFNISRHKDNQEMKTDQTIEYTMRNIFLGKSYTKCGEETKLKKHFMAPFYAWGSAVSRLQSHCT